MIETPVEDRPLTHPDAAPREQRGAVEDRPLTKPEAVRHERSAADRRRGRITTYLAIAAVSLALGAGGTLLALRYLPRQPAAGSSASAGATTTSPQAESRGMAEMGATAPTGHPADTESGAVYISPARQQLIGVRTATVGRQALDTTIRTVGTLAYDETRVTQIHTKITGWVERLYVDYVGKAVRRGEPLFTVYSPELVSTQNEYLLALKARQQLGGSSFPETRAGAESLLSATRDRLRLWDISDAQIEQLEQTGQPRKSLTLYSPFDGVVLERNAFAGQYITPEMSTFKIADLSTIWVLGQIFEYETRTVKLGQGADIEFPYGQSTRRLKGRITFIYPEIDPQTRRVKVRIEFRNPGFELKPETYVTVLIRTGGGSGLALPKEAVIDNGAKQYAILAHPDGYFEPREIEVGQPMDDFFPLVSGLMEGDQVVTSAQFLIDSETNLQAALQSMSMSMPGMERGGDDRTKEGIEPAGRAPAEPKPPSQHNEHKQ